MKNLPEQFGKLDVIVNKQRIQFDIIEFTMISNEFNAIQEAMLKAPSMYSYFIQLKIEQDYIVRKVKDEMESWEAEVYSNIESENPKMTVTAIKKAVQQKEIEVMVKKGDKKVSKKQNGHSYYNEKLKQAKKVLDQLEGVVKAIEKMMAMLQSIGAMRRYELEHLEYQVKEKNEKPGKTNLLEN